MPYFPRRMVEHIYDDTDGSASDPAPQLPVATGTRAPQSTPAGGNTPRNNTPTNNTPRNNSPRAPSDAESCAYGKVIVHYGGPDVGVARERIRVQLDDGTIVELFGQKARDAKGNEDYFEEGLTVEVKYLRGTNEVKEIRPCEVIYDGDGRITGPA